MFYIILIIINLITIYLFKRKKIKQFLFKKKIQEVSVEDIHPIFKTRSGKFKFPTENYITNFFVIPDNYNVIGMTSDKEAWILSMMSKVSKKIFEFGTCSGKTSYLMALNSPEDTSITTITLKPDVEISKKNKESKSAYRNIFSESIYEEFMFSKTNVENKVDIRFINSLELDEKEFLGKCDLIFIDGGHTYSIVKSDTEKAFKMLSPNGFIFWHDYVPGKNSSKDVFKYLNELNESVRLYSVKDTSLVYFKNE